MAGADLLGVAIDHVVVNVLDRLDEAQDRYRKLGFRLTDRGHHSLGSSNHLAIFKSNYLELLGYEPGAETKRASLWRNPAGLTGLVFKLPDPDSRELDLKTRDVPIDEPKEFNRPVLLADGSHDARFRVIDVKNTLFPYGRVFFCHHYTPELVWRSEDQDHPNAATDVAEFVIASRDPARTAAPYGQMFGADLLKPVSGGVFFPAGAANVSILHPAAIEKRLGVPLTDSADDNDRMVALVFQTESLGSAKNCLVRGEVPHFSNPDGGITVHPRAGLHAILAFVQ